MSQAPNGRLQRLYRHTIMKILASITVLLMLVGCATPAPDVVTFQDATGLQTDLLGENLLDTKSATREMIWLNASRVFKTQHEFNYYLEVHYAANEETGYLDIYPGKSLVLIADGREMKLDGIGSLNSRRVQKTVVGEDALYETSAETLRLIANAKQVKVKVIGRNGIVEREFGPENFDRFKRFVARSVDVAPRPVLQPAFPGFPPGMYRRSF